MTWTDIAWNILYALIILIAGNVLGTWLRGLMATWMERTRLDPIVRRLVVSMVRPIVIGLALFAALQQLGIGTTFAAIAGAVTLAVGMSLQGSLSNVASGTLLLTFRPFNVGDVVTVAGNTGTVQQLSLFTTTLHTPAGQTVTVPNDSVWKGSITNYSDRPTRRVRIELTLPVTTDLAKAEEALTAALADQDDVLEEPAPGITYATTTDVGIVVAVTAHTTNADYWGVLSALQRRCLVSLKDAGVTLATRAT